MQGSNDQGNGGNNGDDVNGSGNNDDNIIRLPNAQQRAKATPHKTVKTTIFMGPTSAGHSPGQNMPPNAAMINLPPMTKMLVFLILGIELVMKLVLDPTQQYWVIEHFGFVPAYYTGDMSLSTAALIGPFSYALLHGGWAHVGVNAVMLMAFGAGLERWMGWKKLALLMLSCSVIAAGVHFIFSLGSQNPVIGLSGAISGMFAAALVMLQQVQMLNGTKGRFGLLPLVAVWVGVTILFGVVGGPGGENIAWIAHIGGFLVGFLLVRPLMQLKG